jgi:hypothetical protein
MKFQFDDDELAFNSRRWLAILRTAGSGCDMPFAITGPANNTKSTTKFISSRRGRGSAASSGGSSAQPKTGVCASSICRPARVDFDHDAPIGLLMQSQREAVYDRAMRRARKLLRRLGGDPMDDHYPPEKPPRMRGPRTTDPALPPIGQISLH